MRKSWKCLRRWSAPPADLHPPVQWKPQLPTHVQQTCFYSIFSRAHRRIPCTEHICMYLNRVCWREALCALRSTFVWMYDGHVSRIVCKSECFSARALLLRSRMLRAVELRRLFVFQSSDVMGSRVSLYLQDIAPVPVCDSQLLPPARLWLHLTDGHFGVCWALDTVDSKRESDVFFTKMCTTGSLDSLLTQITEHTT